MKTDWFKIKNTIYRILFYILVFGINHAKVLIFTCNADGLS